MISSLQTTFSINSEIYQWAKSLIFSNIYVDYVKTLTLPSHSKTKILGMVSLLFGIPGNPNGRFSGI